MAPTLGSVVPLVAVASAPVEMLAMDAPGRDARQPQIGLEAAEHPRRPTHEDGQLSWVTVGGAEDAVDREAPVDAGVDQVRVQRSMAVGNGTDLLRERSLAHGGIE